MSIRILVVEDEAVPGLLLKKKLTREGFDVLGPITSGEEAIESALENPPEVIIMDIVLSGRMTGMEAAKEIHKQLDEVRFVFISGYNYSDVAKYAEEIPGSKVLSKPYTSGDLMKSIHDLL